MMQDCMVPTFKHSGSIMVGGYYSGHGTGDLVQVDEIIKAAVKTKTTAHCEDYICRSVCININWK